MRRPDAEVRTAIRARGLRATSARIAVLHALREAAHPISHAELLLRLPPEHDRTTIFRVLATLVRSRLARRIDVGDRVWRYKRLDEREGTEPSASFVCTECGGVESLAELALKLPRTRVPRAVRMGRIEVIFHGVCDACAGDS